MRAPSLTIKPKALASAAAAVKAGVNAKSSIQAIGGVRIIAARTGAKLVTGNGSLSVSVPISAKVTGKIDCVVLHADMVKALKQFARDSGVVHNDLVSICRNGAQLERYIDRGGPRLVPIRRESPSDLLRAINGEAS